MNLLDIMTLTAAWFTLIGVLYLVQKLGRVSSSVLRIFYAAAIVVRGRENVEKFLEKASRLVASVPDKVLITLVCAIFVITMLFLIPVPILLFPVPPIRNLFIAGLFLSSPVVSILRNLVLIAEAIFRKVTPEYMLSMGFLSLQPIIPGLTVNLTTFILIIVTAGISVTAHELAHGIVAKKYGVRIRSGGFFTSFFILMGGFVEPEEEDLRSLPLEKRLAIYSAGVVANIVLAYITLAVFLLLSLATRSLGGPLGLLVAWSNMSNIPPGSRLLELNGTYVLSTYDFVYHLSNILYAKCIPGTVIVLKFLTPQGAQLLHLKLSQCYLGSILSKITLSTVYLKNPPMILKNTVLYEFLFWLFNLNITLALLNALPAYPLDGGQFLEAVLEYATNRKTAHILTMCVSALFFLGLVLTIVYTFKTGLYVTS